jgi:CheY-specific phosphatase CheX
MNSKNTDLRLITLFLESFQGVFAKVFDREVKKGPITVLGRQSRDHAIAVLAGVVGAHYTGTVIFWIQENTARKMLEYLDPTATDFQETLYEGLGEVVNIVSGNAVQHLARNGIELAMTTPSLVVGGPMEIHMMNQNAYSITMLSPFGQIGIDIAVKQL